MHPIKTGKFRGCVTTEILIFGSTRPAATIFKPKSIKGVVFDTMKVLWVCAHWNCIFATFNVHFLIAFRLLTECNVGKCLAVNEEG